MNVLYLHFVPLRKYGTTYYGQYITKIYLNKIRTGMETLQYLHHMARDV